MGRWHRGLFALLCAGMLFTCSSVIENNPSESGTIGSMDIPAPGFFWMLRPWKDGTLVTMDGNARFAELSFVGESRIRITPLVNFPRERIDRVLRVAPEAGICVTKSGALFHVADISSGKTKSLAPFMNWRFSEGMPYIFDSANGLINFYYYRNTDINDGYLSCYNIIYDAKNDKILYESPERGEAVSLEYNFTPELTLSQQDRRIGSGPPETVFYNWKTREIISNELTEKLNDIGFNTFLGHGRNINLAGRFLFADIRISEDTNKKVKITWDENYEDVEIIPLDYLIPEGKWLYDIYLSVDGKWATTFVGGYEGLYGELLDKRVFFHLDNRYPNGISMPIFVDDYDEYHAEQGSFVEHPVHGWCFAEEKYRGDNGSEKLYLRLYKMSDVLAEINR